jgi:hypothetical protein
LLNQRKVDTAEVSAFFVLKKGVEPTVKGLLLSGLLCSSRPMKSPAMPDKQNSAF